MAVIANAEPIDVALDQLARFIGEPIAAAADAVRVMSLWHLVFGEAMRGGDVPLAVLAAKEWRVAMRAARALARSPD